MNENITKPIPSAMCKTSFHDETWYSCPHCNRGVEAYQWVNTDRREIKICSCCGGKAVVGYYGLYYEDDC